MIRKYLLPIFSIFGLMVALFMVFISSQRPPTPPIFSLPPVPPYEHHVAGSGMIEALSEGIYIGSPFNEIVKNICVKVGDYVSKGAPLFELDTLHLQAQYNEVEKEEATARVYLEDVRTQLSLYDKLGDKRAVSQDLLNQKYYATQIAEKDLERLSAKKKVIATDIFRSTIRAPMDGEVLQVNIHPGERTDISIQEGQPLILFGQTKPLHIRVEVDENDSWRVKKGAPAIAYARGNSSIQVPLTFEYIEPFIVPKTALSGDNQERVDTRVLQIVFSFDPGKLPLYPGQLMDVYIKGLPSDARF